MKTHFLAPARRIARKLYDLGWQIARPRGVEWRTGESLPTFRLDARIRHFEENFSSDIWKSLFAEARPGDVVVDVGANVGIYTLMLALKLGEKSRVIAYEPEPGNFDLLQSNIRLNGLAKRVQCINAAVGASGGEIGISSNGPLSHVGPTGETKVPMVALDQALANVKVDLLKIDVEGFEEMVLQGAMGILTDPKRAPRVIYIELHPTFWKGLGVSTTAQSLNQIFEKLPYRLFLPGGHAVTSFENIWCCFGVLDEQSALRAEKCA